METVRPRVGGPLEASIAGYWGRTFVSLRRHRNYRLFFIGQVVSLSGTWMQDTALPWLVFDRTHSAVAVGLLLFCRYVPFTLFSLSAGVFADRFDNRHFLIGTQTMSMVIAAVLAVFTLLGSAPLSAIYALTLLGGTAVVFDSPNRHALTFRLVGRDELANAVALNTSLFNLARVTGPGIGGVVIALAGVGVCFAVNTLSFLAVLAVLLLMRTHELYPLAREGVPARGLTAIREGLSYIKHEPRLRLILLLTAVISVVGFNFRVILPVLTSQALRAGPGVFGFIYASFGAGALLGALVAAGAERPTWKRLLVAIAGLGITLVAIAPVHLVWVDAVLIFGTGICFSLWTATSQSILQIASPDRLRGRVISLYVFVFAGFMPLGSLLAGWLAAAGGSQLALFVEGFSTALVGAYGFQRLRKLRAPAIQASLGKAVEFSDPPAV